jgi:uncharacterized caspase-like protein
MIDGIGDRSQIVLIGTSHYMAKDQLPDIPEIANNITDLARLLTDDDFGIAPLSQCTTLLDELSLPGLGRKLRTAAEQAKDVLVVYFAGHGLKAGPRHELYLAMHETDPEEPDFGSLKYDTLKRIVLESPARAKVVILDCCFSGRAFGDELGGDDALLGQLAVDGCSLLTSAQADNVALVLPGTIHTAFTGELLSVLGQGLPIDSEFVTFDDVYRSLRERLQRQNLPTPLARTSRTSGDVVLSRNRAFAEIAAATMRRRHERAADAAAEGRWQAVLPDLRTLASEQTRVLGAEHFDTQRTRLLLAHAVGATGDPREASHLLRELLEVQSGSLGPDHEETMRTRQYLAVNLGEAGLRVEAAAMLRILLPDRRRVLGAMHPDALRTQHMLARNLADLGARTEAVGLLRELIHVCQSIDPAPPTMIWAQRDLAVLTATDPQEQANV